MSRIKFVYDNRVFFNNPEKYLFIDMIARYIKEKIIDNANVVATSANTIDLPVNEHCITKSCGASVLYTAYTPLLTQCNIYRDLEQFDPLFKLTEFNKNQTYQNIFSGIFTIDDFTIQQAIEYYIKNKKRYNLCGLLLVHKDTVLNPLHFMSAMSYIADGAVHYFFEKKYKAIYYTANIKEYNKCKNVDLGNMTGRMEGKFLELVQSLSKVISEYEPKFAIEDTANISDIGNEIDYKDILNNAYNPLDISNSNNYGLNPRSKLNIRKENSAEIFRVPSTNYCDDNTEAFHIIPQGLLNASGVIYPSYGLIIANFLKEANFYRGTSDLTPFKSVNAMCKIDTPNNSYNHYIMRAPKSNEMKDLMNRSVCVGSIYQSSTIHTELARLYHSNGNSSYHNNTQLPGFIQFMELSIKFSLKLWEKYFEKNK